MAVVLCDFLHGLEPTMVMFLVQVIGAGLNLMLKLASKDGMNLQILVAYRCIFATIFLAPLAFIVERNSRPRLTQMVIFQAFLCGLLGGTMSQNLYVACLEVTSVTFATAMGNLIPASTYIMAVIFRLERLGLRTLAGKAKILGTVIGIGGAMVLTFYKGVEINLWSTAVNLTRAFGSGSPTSSVHHSSNYALGLLLAIGCCLSYALWLIVETKMSQSYPSFFSMTTLICFMASIQSVIYALCFERKSEEWKLGWNIRLWTVAYSGLVAMGMMFTLIAWVVSVKGPLFVSVFSPLALVLVAIMASLILDEKLHVGSTVGLYVVLWGKGKELKRMSLIGAESKHFEVVVTSMPSSSPTTVDTSINHNPDMNFSDDAPHNPVMVSPAVSRGVEEENDEIKEG